MKSKEALSAAAASPPQGMCSRKAYGAYEAMAGIDSLSTTSTGRREDEQPTSQPSAN